MIYRGLTGQSAIEYLMTYGWMLLVVAVVGGAIFATVGNQSVDSTSGFSGSDVMVDNFGISEDNELGLNLRSASGSGVVVSRVNVSDPDAGEWVYKEFTGDKRIGIGSSKIFELPNVSRSDSGNELDVEIVYDSGSLSNLSVRGTVSGSLELTDTGSFEGLPEDDHQSISDEGGESGSLSLLETVNYTYDDSGDVQVNETTAGSDGYKVDLNNDFSEPVEEIEIVEMHGADGTDDQDLQPGSGGLIQNAVVNASSLNSIEIWAGETSTTEYGGWGRSKGGRGESHGGGGSTEIWANSNTNFVAAADAGGGAASVGAVLCPGGGGARGGAGGVNGGCGNDGSPGEGSGEGGRGGGNDQGYDGKPGGQEINNSLIENSGDMTAGGSSEGHGWILLEYYG